MCASFEKRFFAGADYLCSIEDFSIEGLYDAIGFGLGLHNDEAIGIQLAGSTNFTYHQVSSLKNLIKTLQQKYGKLIIETSSKDIEQELK